MAGRNRRGRVRPFGYLTGPFLSGFGNRLALNMERLNFKRYVCMYQGKRIGFAELPADAEPTAEEMQKIRTLLISLHTANLASKDEMPEENCPKKKDR